MTLRVVVIAEDRRFVDFLVPAIGAVAEAVSVPVEVVATEPVRGCRIRKLKDTLERVAGKADLVVVAADAAGPGYSQRRVTHRRKARGLSVAIGMEQECSLAVAAPCVEAWLLADSDAFASGIEEGARLGGRELSFVRPHAWPAPGTEREVKHCLGRVVHDAIGGPLPRSGFEFAPEIVKRAQLLDSRNDSLAHWARDLARRLRGIRRSG